MRVRTSYDYEPIDIDVANRRRKTYRISDDVSDDAAALCASSRRQDQRLLSNITNKLNEFDHQPAPVIHHYRSKPPLPPSAATVVHRPPRHQAPHVVVAAPSVRTVVLRQGARASSVPPRSSALDAEVDAYMEGAHRSRSQARDLHYSAPPEIAPVRLNYRAASEPPPSANHHVANMAVKQAKMYLDRIESELGVTDSHYSVPERSMLISRPHAAPRMGGAYGSRRYMPVSPSVHRSSRIADIETRLDLHSDEPCGPPPTSYSNLRQRTVQAQDKMDRTKTMLDRYLPIYLGPEIEVKYEVENKYSELANRSAKGAGECQSSIPTDRKMYLTSQVGLSTTGQRQGPRDRILLLTGPLPPRPCLTPGRGYVRYYAKPKRTPVTTSRLLY